ncbi:MAG: rod shape-determining protein [Bacteroidia bacterium]|nr:rod shape-determining protein [Bacteroidia bacterium]MBT8278728.1 rod shape-determining protein [Bacteroidia bacterium]NNK60521.1 exopolyphosphatase [Flavobacteriaceae bacterium]RZW52819.1 MAG: exopolyphosphatase [Flavobacteriaceae bacterium]
MLSIKKYAAIDIGSNAVRLLIANIIEEPENPVLFRKSSLVRVPIRLGSDVFLNNSISPQNIERMLDTMQAFKLLMRSHKVERYKACATSAMREASNGEEVAKLILEQTAIEIDIIDGEEEASIIAATDINEYIQKDKNYLYVDVGGGSTEFSIIHNGEKVSSKSFKIGTVRLLNDIVKRETWMQAEEWVQSNTKEYDSIEVIGSGGNINKIFKISGKAIGKPLTYFYLSSFYHNLSSYTYEERITQLNLNQDRADVIIHATRIYLSAMKWSRSKHIYVPKIGLADGIIKSLYFETVSSKVL